MVILVFFNSGARLETVQKLEAALNGVLQLGVDESFEHNMQQRARAGADSAP